MNDFGVTLAVAQRMMSEEANQNPAFGTMS